MSVAGDQAPLQPRLLDKAQAAAYMGGVSIDQVDRLINSGALAIVRLPASRGRGAGAMCRRVLLDRLEIDALVERWRERRGDLAPSIDQPLRTR